MRQFRSLRMSRTNLNRSTRSMRATLSKADGQHQPKVGKKSSQGGNYSPIPSSLLHGSNTLREFEDESRRRVRSSLEFHITPAQDHFREQNSGM
jgi:hypothetical protein